MVTVTYIYNNKEINKELKEQLLLSVKSMCHLLESLLIKKHLGFCFARCFITERLPSLVWRTQEVPRSHIFTCAGFVQLPFAEPQLRAVHCAGVKLQPEHRVPVSSMHPPVVALDLQGAAETEGRRELVFFLVHRHNEGVWSVKNRLSGSQGVTTYTFPNNWMHKTNDAFPMLTNYHSLFTKCQEGFYRTSYMC